MMPTCRNVSRLIAAGEVESLPLLRRLSIKLHVSMCRHCARFARELRRIGEAARMQWSARGEDSEVIARLERSVLADLGGATDGGGDEH